jgi:hypothetical protein
MIAALDDGRICRTCDTGRCENCLNYKARLER